MVAIRILISSAQLNGPKPVSKEFFRCERERPFALLKTTAGREATLEISQPQGGWLQYINCACPGGTVERQARSFPASLQDAFDWFVPNTSHCVAG
jgi:hypothetical protein